MVIPQSIPAVELMVGLRADEASLVNSGRVQVMGQNIFGSDVGAGVFGPGAGGVTELKHGVVTDETVGTASGSVFLFRVRRDDPPTSGPAAQRSERYFSGSGQTIPQQTDVWFAVRVKASAWDTDTRRIIWQWHEDSPVSGLSPHLSATINGNRLRLIVLHNDNETLTSANTTQQVIYTDDNWQPDAWYDFVIKARVDPAAEGAGYVKAWINGALAADYVGPVGYRQESPEDYAKVGIYHWNSEANQWRDGAPDVVETRVAAMVLLMDQSGVDHLSVRRLLR